jgi:hypothetical protein
MSDESAKILAFPLAKTRPVNPFGADGPCDCDDCKDDELTPADRARSLAAMERVSPYIRALFERPRQRPGGE